MNRPLLLLSLGLAVIAQSAYSGEPLPDQWSGQDVGEVQHHGSVEYAEETFKINGSGADIWEGADSFYYAYRPLEGDGSIIAHFKDGLNFVDPFAKAGVMVRSTLEANAANALLAVTSQNGATFQARKEEGGSTTQKLIEGKYSSAAGGTGLWLKLERIGNIVSASTSTDGTEWTFVEESNITLTEKVFIGLAMTTHDANQKYGFATFDHVKVTDSSKK